MDLEKVAMLRHPSSGLLAAGWILGTERAVTLHHAPSTMSPDGGREMGEMAEWVGEESCSICGCSFLEFRAYQSREDCDCECHEERTEDARED